MWKLTRVVQALVYSLGNKLSPLLVLEWGKTMKCTIA